METSVALRTATYHVRVMAGCLAGEGGEAKVAANYLLGVVEDAAVWRMAQFTEADLLRGFCSAQKKTATLATALLSKAAGAKVEVEPLKA